MMSLWYFYSELRTNFIPFSGVSINDFEQVNVTRVLPLAENILQIILQISLIIF